MYLWKCWRDTRMLFIVSLIVALIVMPASVLTLGTRLLMNSGPASVSSTLFLITSLMAFGLGALGASEQFGDKTVHFLYTKPRRRAYFVWVNWTLGCIELGVVALVNIVVGWVVLVRYARGPEKVGLWKLVEGQPVVEILIYCLLLYCLTYALTAMLRKGLYGLGASIIGVSFCQATAILLRARWHIHAPIPGEQIGPLSPFISEITWVLLALSFVLATQLVVERSEI